MDRRLLDQLAGEALRELLHAVRAGTLFCRSTAERLHRSVEPLLPLVQVLGPHTQRFEELGELAVWPCGSWRRSTWHAASPRWNVYRVAQLSRRMEADNCGIARWLERHAAAHVIGGVRRLRDEARIGYLECRVEEIAVAAQPVPRAPALSVPVVPPPSHKGVPMRAAMPMEEPLAKAAFAAVPMEVPPHKGMAMSVPTPGRLDGSSQRYPKT